MLIFRGIVDHHCTFYIHFFLSAIFISFQRLFDYMDLINRYLDLLFFFAKICLVHKR
jgi:hypothetical protein